MVDQIYVQIRGLDMPGSNFLLHLFAFLVSSLFAAGCFSSIQRIDGTTEAQAFEIYATSVVVSDPRDLISVDSGIGVIGDYKYSLDGSLAPVLLRGAETDSSKTVVKDLVTGRIGVTEGKLIIKYAAGNNPDNIALDYGYEVVDHLRLINRMVVKLPNLTDLPNVQSSLRLDERVLETSLEVDYGGYRLR